MLFLPSDPRLIRALLIKHGAKDINHLRQLLEVPEPTQINTVKKGSVLVTRSADRETFYARVLRLVPSDDSRHPWAEITNYREYMPDLPHEATLSPGRQGGGNVSFTLREKDGEEYKVVLGTIIQGFTEVRDNPVKGLGESARQDIIDAWRTSSWQDLDAWDTLDVLQIGLWGEVRY